MKKMKTFLLPILSMTFLIMCFYLFSAFDNQTVIINEGATKTFNQELVILTEKISETDIKDLEAQINIEVVEAFTLTQSNDLNFIRLTTITNAVERTEIFSIDNNNSTAASACQCTQGLWRKWIYTSWGPPGGFCGYCIRWDWEK